jgi:hypothetical protein
LHILEGKKEERKGGKDQEEGRREFRCKDTMDLAVV